MSYYNWNEIVEKYTDAELIDTVKGNRGLQNEKIIAAAKELEKRGIESDNYKRILIKSDNEELEPDENSPKLYSDKVIYTFSILFSVVFGGILLSINLKEADKRKGIFPVITFSILYTALTIYILELINAGNGGTLLMGAIGAAILKEFFWNKYLGKGTVYHKKSWVKPLIIALVIFTPIVMFVIWANSIAV